MPLDYLRRKHAHDLTARLMQVVGEELGLPLDRPKAEQITVQLIGHPSWGEPQTLIAQKAPVAGADKRALPPTATARRKHQIDVLQTMLNVPDSVAAEIREAIAPPGYDPEQEDLLAGRPSARRLNLPLNAEDELWLARALALTAEFHRTVLPIYKIDPETMDLAIGRSGDAQVLRHWDADNAPLSAHQRIEVAERKTRAAELVSALDAMIAGLGKAPFLFPCKEFALTLWRRKVGIGGRSYWTLLGPEPWLEMSYDIPGTSWSTDVQWNASRSLRLLLGLRREFLGAGWTDEGPAWEITLRYGRVAVEALTITAPDAGKAVAAFVAAWASLKLTDEYPRLGTMVLLGVRGPEGPLDPERVVAAANGEPLIKRGKLTLTGRLVAGRTSS